jgi:hypothetical protein
MLNSERARVKLNEHWLASVGLVGDHCLGWTRQGRRNGLEGSWLHTGGDSRKMLGSGGRRKLADAQSGKCILHLYGTHRDGV